MQVHLRCDVESAGFPAVLLPSGRGVRGIRRQSLSRRAARLGQLVLITLAAAALTTFLRQAMA
jgi:hypothetical protein